MKHEWEILPPGIIGLKGTDYTISLSEVWPVMFHAYQGERRLGGYDKADNIENLKGVIERRIADFAMIGLGPHGPLDCPTT